MAAHTLKEIQQRLNRSASTSPKLVVDGEKGGLTTAAVVAFQKASGIMPETGIVDARTLAKLFPEDGIPMTGGQNHTIQATVTDWALNWAQSKIVWAAGALVALAVGWISTKFGIEVPADAANWVTSGIVMLGGVVIAILRGWGKDTPRVADKSPAVIQKPAEYVGQSK